MAGLKWSNWLVTRAWGSRMKGVRLGALLAALLVVTGGCRNPLSAQVTDRAEIHSKHVLYGTPTGTPKTNDLLVREIYALSSNDSTKFADWVGYRIDSTTVRGTSPDRRWRSDPWLDEEETLEPSDYDGAFNELGTHRGHQAPLAAFRGTEHAEDTNYLSNITPQMGALNGGPWAQLENSVRSLAEEKTIYVLTGPLYEREMPSLPQADERHRIPSGYWKVVAVRNDTAVEWAAFIMDQTLESGADYCEQQVSVNDVEARSGLDFFWELPGSIEEQIESERPGRAVVSELGC